MEPIPTTKTEQANLLVKQAGWNKNGKSALVQVTDDILQLQPGGQLIYCGKGGWDDANAAFSKTSNSGQCWRLLH